MQKKNTQVIRKKLTRKNKQQQQNLTLSPHIRRNAPFLKAVAQCRSVGRAEKLLSTAGAEQLLCLVECCLNLLQGRLPVSSRRLARLRPYAAHIRALSQARSVGKVRSELQKHQQQSGRGIPLVVASLVVRTLLPAIIETVASKFGD